MDNKIFYTEENKLVLIKEKHIHRYVIDFLVKQFQLKQFI